MINKIFRLSLKLGAYDYEKFKTVARFHRLSMTSLLESFVKNCIAEFENKYGPINMDNFQKD